MRLNVGSGGLGWDGVPPSSLVVEKVRDPPQMREEGGKESLGGSTKIAIPCLVTAQTIKTRKPQPLILARPKTPPQHKNPLNKDKNSHLLAVSPSFPLSP